MSLHQITGFWAMWLTFGGVAEHRGRGEWKLGAAQLPIIVDSPTPAGDIIGLGKWQNFSWLSDFRVEPLRLSRTWPAGEVARHFVLELHETDVAAVGPKETDVAPVTKPVPLTVTMVPPASGPAIGVRPMMLGAAS